MSRLKKCASKTSDITNKLIEQISNELRTLAVYLDDPDSDSYVDSFNGTITIKCKEQYGGFNLLLNIEGDTAKITNEAGNDLNEMIETYNDQLK